MNDHTANNSTENLGPLPFPSVMPTELRETAGLLDALADFDRAAAPAGMEARVLRSVSEGVAKAVEAGEMALREPGLEQLGVLDREHAGSTFEDRIFMATRGILVAHAHGPASHKPVVRTFRMTGMIRVAAALGLGAGVIWGYQALMGPVNDGPNFPGIKMKDTLVAKADKQQKLENELDQHLSKLGDVLAMAMIDADSDTSGSSTSADGDALGDWFQYDFVEGGGSL